MRLGGCRADVRPTPQAGAQKGLIVRPAAHDRGGLQLGETGSLGPALHLLPYQPFVQLPDQSLQALGLQMAKVFTLGSGL